MRVYYYNNLRAAFVLFRNVAIEKDFEKYWFCSSEKNIFVKKTRVLIEN